ncbi:helix-turn-helix transcriptional regulator [Bifidobacterium olomucense]|uniref:PbsX family transcriptional regulator n=1 Tax=Bifidobacterium olomucense TaxID=2675324 RepID=A0A7Y0EZB9_9BIFI|nr:helix-turn-helix transcriptional regulator [Bifidobacterium sp. DSM 109959]NMM98141.1 PbsX family transcriptional regulator [Bifidobacterium sp. DSM 109959]
MSIKSERVRKGLTQQQLADKVPSMTRGRIAAYETGAIDVGNMTLDMALRFLEAFGRKALARQVRAVLIESPEGSKENDAK